MILLTIPLQAQVVHVDVANGANSNTCGTPGAPCETIQYAIDSIANYGDTLYLHSGTYSIPNSVDLDTAVAVLPEGMSLTFLGDSTGFGATINGNGVRRGVHYDHSTTCPDSYAPHNGVNDTLELVFDNVNFMNCYWGARLCNNVSHSWGSAINIVNSPNDGMLIRIRHCEFVSNEVDDNIGINVGGRSSRGGAISIIGRMHFSTNTGLYCEVEVDDCQFSNNLCEQNVNGGHGGALYIQDVNVGNVTNSVFCNNAAFATNADNGDLGQDRNAGGAICVMDRVNANPAHQFVVDNCAFHDNSALAQGWNNWVNSSEGGAIFLTHGDNFSLTSNCVFNVSNSHFVNNTVDNGLEHVDNNVGTLNSSGNGNIYLATFDIDLGPDDTLCPGETILLTVDQWPGATYQWQDGSTDTLYLVANPGVYWVEVNFGGCTYSDTMEVFPDIQPVFSLGPDTAICPGDSFTLDPGLGVGNYLWSTMDTTMTLTVTQPGIYWLRYDTTGCFGYDSVEVTTQVVSGNNFLGPDTILCLGDTVLLNASQPGATYLWQDQSVDSTYTVTNPGMYWVEVDSGGCILADTVAFFPPSSFSLGPDTTICPGDSTQLVATTLNSSYLWQNGDTTATLWAQDSGTYWVVVDSAGCATSDTVELTMAIPIAPGFLGNDTNFCDGDSLLLNPGFSNTSYSWQNSSTDSTFNVSATGTYWVTVDSNGCPTTDSIVITVDPLPSSNLGPDSTLCFGDSITLDASEPGASYLWSNASTDSTLTVNSAGTYWVSVTLGNCSLTDSVDITFEPDLSFSLGNDTTFCSGPGFALSIPVNGVNYLWDNADSTQTRTVNSTGTYWGEAQSGNCTFRDSIDVTVIPTPVVDLGNDTGFCPGDSLLLNPMVTGTGAYLWQNGSTATSQWVSTAGTYSLTVDSAGCAGTDSVTISVATPIAPGFLGNDTAMCAGSSLLLDPGFPNTTYQWQNSSTTSTFNVTASGMYWVTADSSGCPTTDTINVTVQAVPTPNLGNDTTLCFGETMTLDVTEPGATYLWSTGNTTATQTITSAGTYSVTVSFGNCSGSDSIVVYYEPDLSFSIGPDTTVCSNETLILSIPASGASHFWDNGSFNANRVITSSGTYSATATSAFCAFHDTINVTIIQSPSVDLGNDTLLCPDDSVLLNAAGSSGLVSYLWHDNSTLPTYWANGPGAYWVTVSSNGCIDQDTVLIGQNTLPDSLLGNDTAICQGENLLLEAAFVPGASYIWSDTTTLSSTTVSQTGTYWVQVNLNGCLGRDSIDVTVNPLPVVNLGPDQQFCPGDSVVLDATTFGGTYDWNNGSTSGQLTTFVPGQYVVTVTVNNCFSTDQVNLTQWVLPTVLLGPDTTLCIGDSLVLNPQFNGWVSGLWSSGSVDSTLTVSDSGIYWVSVSNPCGTATDSIMITTATCDPCEIWFANAFTPDNDLLNDGWRPITVCGFSEYRLYIFDRWGHLIYETDNPHDEWSGTHRGETVQQGVYIWRLDYQFDLYRGDPLKKRYGHVTVVR